MRWYTASCLVTWFVAELTPDRVQVVLRDVVADPWQILWCLPGCIAPMCLSGAFDHMEATLASPAYRRRLLVSLTLVSVPMGLMACSVATNNRSLASGAVGILLTVGLVLLATVLAGAAVAMMVVFAIVLINWVFGIGELEMRPHGWALLVQEPSPAMLTLTGLVFMLGTVCWAVKGSRA